MSAAKLGRQQETGEVTSLTGRIPIWRELRYDIAERPLFGYGYGCFWTGPRVYYLSALLDWEFDHAHSIYLQTILNLGLIGLALGLAVVIMTMRRAAAAYHRSGDIGYGFALAWLGMALPHGLLDSVFVQTGFAMLLCLLCLGVVAFHSREVLGADA